MKISVTLRSVDVSGLRVLLDEVRTKIVDLTVLEAPNAPEYPYPFPIVMVSSSSGWERHFGDDAMHVLKNVARQKALA